MISFSDFLTQIPEVSRLDFESAVVLIVSVAIAFIAISLQFITVLRHRGQDAVVNSFTWLLLAGFAAAVGAMVWQRHGDFFLMLTLEILASGALSGYLLNLRYRRLLAEVSAQREAAEYVPTEHENVAAALRERLRAARLAKNRPVE